MKEPRGPFDDPPIALRLRVLAPVTVMVGSLVTILPLVASIPVLPPVGLMLLLAWRLRRPEALATWAPLPLGLFDDLVSGQPLGSSMLLWTLCFLSIGVIDRRLMFRDFWQDWLVAAGGIAACLAGGRWLASPFDAHVDTVLLVQIAASILLFPLAANGCARLDAARQPA